MLFCSLLLILTLLETKLGNTRVSKCPGVPFQVFSNPQTSFRENLGLFVEEKACLEKRKVRVIEIGVWRGDFAQEILDRYHLIIDEYVMIEPSEKLTGSVTPELKRRLQEFPLKFPSVKFKYINEISVEASSAFPDYYFDWIYIDALHTYAGVRDDIQHYWPKLQEGGLFSGHDFTSKLSNDPALTLAPWAGRRNGKDKSGFPGSYTAVILHSRSVAIPVYYTLEGRCGDQMLSLTDTGFVFRNNPSWFMFKSKKGQIVFETQKANFDYVKGVFSKI